MKRTYTFITAASIYILSLPTFVAAQSVGGGNGAETGNWLSRLLSRLFGRGNGGGNGFNTGSVNSGIGGGNGNGNGFGFGNGNGNGNAFGFGGGNGNGSVNPVSVPEIDASTGALALAALGAALLLVWEINRRRKSV